MKRIIWHWTAGAPGVIPLEADAYHFIIQPEGTIVRGVPVENNRPPLVNGAYAAHTRGANSDAIGIAVDAMAGAVERPLNLGKHPITQAQVDALVRLSAELGEQYRIPIRRDTMLSHAEVEPTLGIWQRQKWDITWLPGMTAVGDPVKVGDRLRELVAIAAKELAPKPAPVPVREPLRAPVRVTPKPEPTFWQRLLALFTRS